MARSIDCNKVFEVAQYFEKHGQIKTLEKYPSVSPASLERYVRQNKLKYKKFPKILQFDIETSPLEVYVWGLYKQRITTPQVKKDWAVLCWAAKWLCEDKIMGKSVSSEEAINRTDGSIIKQIWNLIDKADIIIAHNGKKFDVRKLNWRFLINGLAPPSPYWIIDTCISSRKEFGATSHELDYLNKQTGGRRKIETKYQMWKDCVEKGNKKPLQDMLTYCKGDINSLEDWYLKMRPWIKSHPPCGAFISAQDEVCPNCASDDLGYTTTDYITPAGRYVGIRCNSCGAVGRLMSNQMDINSRRKLVRSVAK